MLSEGLAYKFGHTNASANICLDEQEGPFAYPDPKSGQRRQSDSRVMIIVLPL